MFSYVKLKLCQSPKCQLHLTMLIQYVCQVRIFELDAGFEYKVCILGCPDIKPHLPDLLSRLGKTIRQKLNIIHSINRINCYCTRYTVFPIF